MILQVSNRIVVLLGPDFSNVVPCLFRVEIRRFLRHVVGIGTILFHLTILVLPLYPLEDDTAPYDRLGIQIPLEGEPHAIR